MNVYLLKGNSVNYAMNWPWNVAKINQQLEKGRQRMDTLNKEVNACRIENDRRKQ
jgi:hypothetical protein